MELETNFPFLPLSHPYQLVFKKNFELLKSHYQRLMSPNLETDLWDLFYKQEGQFSFFERMVVQLDDQKVVSPKKIYIYLGLLTFFEINIKKPHGYFNKENWELFAEAALHSSIEKLDLINKELFKNNVKYYRWTQEEDIFLENLIHQENPNQTKKNPWKILAKRFNEANVFHMTRSAAQLKERWENTLKRKFKKGNWSFQEDMMILNYVENKGTKWAQITRKLQNRNEHNIKNRFFSIISEYLHMTVKDVKKKIDYRQQELLRKTKMHLHSENVVKQAALSLS